MKHKFSLSTIIATFFGVGYIPFAPGTFGSIFAFPLYFIITLILIYAKGGVSGLAAPDLINSILVIITGLFFIGTWAAEEYSKNTGKKDPKEVVIDEVVGQLLTICLIIFLLPNIGSDSVAKFAQIGINESNLIALNFISAFAMFRIFDITKPWPIDYIDKNYKNGLGIMLDDVAAAIFATIVHFALLYFLVDQIKLK